uniref:LCCL domain-containing protein n=1 Tax=Eptatretus burgeri TaxID=7764 RepID=A0A8C4Q3C6_EPTBU
GHPEATAESLRPPHVSVNSRGGVRPPYPSRRANVTHDLTDLCVRTGITVIDCDLRAGNVVNHEFVVRCPPGCREKRVPVWGTGYYASISSICGAAIHSGMIPSSGGPVRVKKSSGRSNYHSSVFHNVRSLPLPNWSGSFQLSGVPHFRNSGRSHILESPQTDTATHS